MCGRLILFNRMDIPVIINDGSNHLVMYRWGLIPYWAEDMSIGNTLINARGETVDEKPSFKHSLPRRRCLVVALPRLF